MVRAREHESRFWVITRLPITGCTGGIDAMSPRLAAKVAGLVHDLHRWRWPFSRRVMLPLNQRVVAAHLAELHEVFTRDGVKFWLRDGSALGAYRERGIIPHDDDIDIGVWWADREGVERAVANLVRRGFVVYRSNTEVIALLKQWETVEICFSGRPGAVAAYETRLEEFFTRLESVELWGARFALPSPIEDYLEFCYGHDWRVPKFAPWSNSCWQAPKDRERHARDFPAPLPR